MTPKENLLAVLRHQEPEWIPWIPLIDRSVNIPVFTPPELRTIEPGTLRCLRISQYLAEHFGADILVRGGGLYDTDSNSVKTTESKNGNVIHYKYETEAGELTSAVEITPYGGSSLMTSRILEHLVKDPHDFIPFKCYLRDITYKLKEERFAELVNQVGERGVICTGAPYTTPIMSLIIQYMGLENFIYALSDYPVETEEVMEIMGDKYLECHKLIATSSAQVILAGDDASTLLISPQLFEKYALPFLRKCTEITHKAGKVFLNHSCGKVRGLLSLIRQSGIDAHEYLTPPPVGDTPFLEAKRIWGDDITIMGAVDPVLMERGQPEKVRKYVIKLLKDMSPGKNFVLETSSKPDVPKQNVQTVADIMNEFRKYPLKIQ